jgi:hypothetical protein
MVDEATADQNDMISGQVLSGGKGIVVLSPSLQILHMNRQAIKLAGMSGPAEPGDQKLNHPARILNSPLTNLGDTILKALRRGNETTGKGQSGLHYAVSIPGKRVMIRGIGVPSAKGLQDSRIVLVLDELSANSDETHRVSTRASEIQQASIST